MLGKRWIAAVLLLPLLGVGCVVADDDEAQVDDESEVGDGRADALEAIAIKTDSTTYPFSRPAGPPVARNGIFRDSSFGTQILRVTDSSDGGECKNGYSYYPSLNLDNTRLLVICDNRPWVINFNPSSFQMTTRKYLANPGFSPTMIDDLLWSSIYTNVFYWHDATRIMSYDVNAGSIQTVKDWGSTFAGQTIRQLSKSENDDTFAFTRRSNATGKYVGYTVWSRTKGTIHNTCWRWKAADECFVDEVRLDKTGTYLEIQTGSGVEGEPRQVVRNLNSGAQTNLYNGPRDKPEGHYDLGRGFLVGVEPSYGPRIQRRSMSSPASYYALGQTGGWTSALHVSMLARNDGWALISSYGMYGDSLKVTAPFQNEIFQVSTDGNWKVRRLARHYSYLDGNYWSMPRANISRDGQFVTYTSNWGGRRDVYMVRIPPAP